MSDRKRKTIKTKVVNDIKVTPLPNNDDDKIIRSSIFKYPNNSTCISATIGSGKTTTLYHILKDHILHYPLQQDKPEYKNKLKIYLGGNPDEPEPPKFHRKLTVIIFSSSLYTDPAYESILNLLKETGVTCMAMVSTYYKERNVISALNNYIRIRLTEKDGEVEGMDEEVMEGLPNINKKLDDLLMPVSGIGDFIIIVDDLPRECKRNGAITDFIKVLRNRNVVNFICITQSAKDNPPDMLNMCQNMLIFKDTPLSRLKHIYEWLSLSISWDDFYGLYKYATKEPHSFLRIDKPGREYFKNLNEKLIIV